jgi:hypothetical protein
MKQAKYKKKYYRTLLTEGILMEILKKMKVKE